MLQEAEESNRSDLSIVTLEKRSMMWVCLTLPDWYFSVEFRQNFYIFLCRKGGAFYVSIFVKIGWIFFILSSKNHENRSDLSSRPVYLIVASKCDFPPRDRVLGLTNPTAQHPGQVLPLFGPVFFL